jgi:hypothetical protein
VGRSRVPAAHDGTWLRVQPAHAHARSHTALAQSPPATSHRRCWPTTRQLRTTCAAPSTPLSSQRRGQASLAFFYSWSSHWHPATASALLAVHLCHRCTQHRRPRVPKQCRWAGVPSSSVAFASSRPLWGVPEATPRCAPFPPRLSPMAAISGQRPPPVSPPRGPHQCPDPLRPARWRRRPCVRTTATVPLQSTRATMESTPGELRSSRPSPNWFTKPSWSSSHCSPAGLIVGEPELAGRRRPVPSARLLYSGWPHAEMADPLDGLGQAISRSGPSA